MSGKFLSTILALLVTSQVFAAETGKKSADYWGETPAPSKAEEKAAVEEAPAEEDPGDGKLLGDWKGFRKTLQKMGITLSPVYSGEFSANTKGGREKLSTYIGKAQLIWDQDWDKLVGWTGGSSHVTLMHLHGKSGPVTYVGDSQSTSNMDGFTESTFKIYEAWVQQAFFENKASVLIGLYDFNSEFYVTQGSLVFLNGAFAVGKETSQTANTGGNSPSVYPTPSLSFRVKMQPSENLYMQAMVADAVAGDPANLSGTHVILDQNDGTFSAVEAGYLRGVEPKSTDYYGKLAVGAWHYSQVYPTFDTGENVVSYGYYLLAEKSMFWGLTAFLRFGYANPANNQVVTNLAAGIVKNKVLPFFDNDQFGVGFTRAKNGRKYLDVQNDAGVPTDEAETTLEILYRVEPIPGFAVQPDFQYVFRPNMVPTREDALWLGARFDISL